MEGLRADAILFYDPEKGETQSFKNRATLRCPEGEHTVPHHHTGQLAPALSSAAGFLCDAAGLTHFPFADLLHLQPSPHLPGAAGLALSLAPAPAHVRQGVLCPVLLKSARERLSHTTPNKSSQTFPWVFLIAAWMIGFSPILLCTLHQV